MFSTPSIDALFGESDDDKLKRIQQRWQNFPGSAPGGTGSTGLGSFDSQGWSDQQNENTWAMNKLREKQGQAPLTVRYGGEITQPEPQYGNGGLQVKDGPFAPSLDALDNMELDASGHAQMRPGRKPTTMKGSQRSQVRF